MCNSFNVKKTVSRIKPEFFAQIVSRHEIPMAVDWTLSPYRYKQDVFQAYLALDDEHARKLEPELVEISNFADWAGAGEVIVKTLQAENIAMPQDCADDTMLNQTAWLYVNHPDLWERLGKFAHIDRAGKSRWFLVSVQNGLEPALPDTDAPDTEALKREIGPYILGHQGRGKFIDITFELRNSGDEYYIVSLSDFKRHETICSDGIFEQDHISKRAATMVFVFHRETRQLEALLPNFSRNEKIALCDKWARVVKNCYITGAEKDKPIYDLSPLLDRNFVFTPDEDGYLESALPTGLCISVRGCPNSKRIYLEKNCNIFDCMEQEMNQRVLPRHARSVEWIDVKVRLSEEFGRSRSQTIHFTPDGHNILDLNAKVHAPLIKIVNGWNIANA